jgi:hypothetical protein
MLRSQAGAGTSIPGRQLDAGGQRAGPPKLLRAGRRDSIHLGCDSLSYPLRHLGLNGVPNHAPRAFDERELVRQAAFKQHADAMVAGYVRDRDQSDVLCDAKMGQVDRS